mmetsp:Transcript_6972/g.12741  ORF Transcript_6972/g.12741 Transcript_6972/m.12741 type:complete len:519 (-) Transcript_6972:1483-3039(-)
MLSIATEHLLAQFFVNVAEGEIQVERLRIQLASQPNFNPLSAFETLSQSFNEISPNQIKTWCDECGSLVDPADAELIVRQYDANEDGRLEFCEFKCLVLPSTIPSLKEEALQRLESKLTDTVKDALIYLIEKEADLQRDLEIRRRDIKARADFTFASAFKAIDRDCTESVDLTQLEVFLLRNEFSLSEDQLVAIFRRLDTDADMKLSYTEFVEGVLPFKPLTPMHRRQMSLPYYSPLRPSRVAKTVVSSPRLSPIKRNSSRIFTPEKELAPERRASAPMKRNFSISSLSTSDMTITDAFVTQISLSNKLEMAKHSLAVRPDFTIKDAFLMFDLENKERLNVKAFEDTFEYLGVYYTKDEPTLLVKHFASDEHRPQINYREFNELFMPRDPRYAWMLKEREPFIATVRDRRRIFSQETTRRLVELLNLALENERIVETIRQTLSQDTSFKISEVFNAIDISQDGCLTLDELRSVLQSHGHIVTEKDLETLMKIYDKDRDGRVSYTEFLTGISPKSPRKY